MKNNNSFAVLLFIVIASIGFALSFAISSDLTSFSVQIVLVLFLLAAVFLAWSTKIANQWNRAVVLRLGKFHSLRGPGLFFIVPVIDTIPYWIDMRVISTAFKAEKTLTRDTVPVELCTGIHYMDIFPTGLKR